jgi:hypothetical protein
VEPLLVALNSIANALATGGNALSTYFQTNHGWLQGLVLGGFALVNSVRIVAYLPQILKAAQDSNGASAISFTTWGLFLLSHLMTILYAVICLGDLTLAEDRPRSAPRIQRTLRRLWDNRGRIGQDSRPL